MPCKRDGGRAAQQGQGRLTTVPQTYALALADSQWSQDRAIELLTVLQLMKKLLVASLFGQRMKKGPRSPNVCSGATTEWCVLESRYDCVMFPVDNRCLRGRAIKRAKLYKHHGCYTLAFVVDINTSKESWPVHTRALRLVDESASFLLALTLEYSSVCSCYMSHVCILACVHASWVEWSFLCNHVCLAFHLLRCSADQVDRCLNQSLKPHASEGRGCFLLSYNRI
jgi:hypothetical protein